MKRIGFLEQAYFSWLALALVPGTRAFHGIAHRVSCMQKNARLLFASRAARSRRAKNNLDGTKQRPRQAHRRQAARLLRGHAGLVQQEPAAAREPQPGRPPPQGRDLGRLRARLVGGRLRRHQQRAAAVAQRARPLRGDGPRHRHGRAHAARGVRGAAARRAEVFLDCSNVPDAAAVPRLVRPPPRLPDARDGLLPADRRAHRRVGRRHLRRRRVRVAAARGGRPLRRRHALADGLLPRGRAV